MADTIRDRSTLLTLTADNTSGDISPQDLRDVIVSVHGVYGGMTVTGSTTAQSVGTTPAKFTGWTTDMTSAGVTAASTGADTLTLLTTGVYDVSACGAFVGTTGQTYTFELYKNSTGLNYQMSQTLVATSRGTFALTGLASVSANDTVSLYISAGTTGQSVTITDAQIQATRKA